MLLQSRHRELEIQINLENIRLGIEKSIHLIRNILASHSAASALFLKVI